MGKITLGGVTHPPKRCGKPENNALARVSAIMMLAAMLVVAAASQGQDTPQPARSFTRSLAVGDVAFRVAVADSAEARSRGLSGLRSMGSDEGLYFVYPSPRLLRFWMKDMSFAIDILWIDSQYRVVHMVENVVPETFPTVFAWQEPAQYALEINAGMVRNKGIAIGDRVVLR